VIAEKKYKWIDNMDYTLNPDQYSEWGDACNMEALVRLGYFLVQKMIAV
jgi:hypothetical protein